MPAIGITADDIFSVTRSVCSSNVAGPILAVAAAMNPAMGAWLALRCRVPFKKGQ